MPEANEMYAAAPAPHVGTPGAGLGPLPLARGTLDRAAHERRDPDLVTTLLADPATRVVEIRGDRMHVGNLDRGLDDNLDDNLDGGLDGAPTLTIRPPSLDDRARLGLFLGRDASSAAYIGVVGDGPAESQHGWLTLRHAGTILREGDAAVFATTQALANWHAAHGHCPRCGAATQPVQGGWVRACPADGSEHYPRTDPAVIMSVIDADERLLLGRAPSWPEGRFSVLAGFVEPGESLEAAVAREVFEEVGVVVGDVRFLGDQPWPFPSSVMIGFSARALTTELRPDPAEIAEAKWVTRQQYREALRGKAIPRPTGISIAQRIIELWLGETVESVIAG